MTRAKEPWKSPLWRSGPSFLYSRWPPARYVGRPAAVFFKGEPATGIVLLACAIVAMLWANSSWSRSYTDLWAVEITFGVGDFVLSHTLGEWINDGLMVIFFFVVGLEIKSEIVVGELRRLRTAVTPVAAAVGGMAVPALIYTGCNLGGAGSDGWGIPMATDIAFALGILALFGSRIPAPARIFLLTLAVVDDLGAIIVIAVFYTDRLSTAWLAAAAVLVLAAVAMRLLNVWSPPLYLVIGLAMWVAMLESGVHATIAGVVMGLLISAKPLFEPEAALAEARRTAEGGLSAAETERLIRLARNAASPAERLGVRFGPFSSFVVLPLFALANAGMALSGDLLADALGSTVTIGIAVGLVAGKFIGVAATTWLVVKTGLGRLPESTSWPLMMGLAAVAGIGFTVALFITGLAFDDSGALTEEAKIGVLGGSIVAGALGTFVLSMAAPGRGEGREGATGER